MLTPILSLLGAVDNLHDAPGFFNHTENVLGVTISCMVSKTHPLLLNQRPELAVLKIYCLQWRASPSQT